MTKIRTKFPFKCLCQNGSKNQLSETLNVTVWWADTTLQIHWPCQPPLGSALHLGVGDGEDRRRKNIAWSVRWRPGGPALSLSHCPYRPFRDSPRLPSCWSSQLYYICKQDLGGKFTLEALKTQYLGWQPFSENQSDPQFFFSLS